MARYQHHGCGLGRGRTASPSSRMAQGGVKTGWERGGQSGLSRCGSAGYRLFYVDVNGVGWARGGAAATRESWQAKAPAPRMALSRGDFGEVENEEGAAVGTDQAAVIGHVDGIGGAPGAFGGGVGGIGQRVGGEDAGEGAALEGGSGFEGGPAIGAHVVVTAVGRATVEHIGGGAAGTGDGELAGPDHRLISTVAFAGALKSGSMTILVLALRSSTNLRVASLARFFSSSGRKSSKDLVGRLSSTLMM